MFLRFSLKIHHNIRYCDLNYKQHIIKIVLLLVFFLKKNSKLIIPKLFILIKSVPITSGDALSNWITQYSFFIECHRSLMCQLKTKIIYFVTKTKYSRYGGILRLQNMNIKVPNSRIECFF